MNIIYSLNERVEESYQLSANRVVPIFLIVDFPSSPLCINTESFTPESISATK